MISDDSDEDDDWVFEDFRDFGDIILQQELLLASCFQRSLTGSPLLLTINTSLSICRYATITCRAIKKVERDVYIQFYSMYTNRYLEEISLKKSDMQLYK